MTGTQLYINKITDLKPLGVTLKISQKFEEFLALFPSSCEAAKNFH